MTDDALDPDVKRQLDERVVSVAERCGSRRIMAGQLCLPSVVMAASRSYATFPGVIAISLGAVKSR